MTQEKALPTLDIEYWDYENGSVGAKLETALDGDMWAKNQETMVNGILSLMDHLIKAEKKRIKKGSTQGDLGNVIQAAWIDGSYTMRFMPVPGFGVSFKTEQNSIAWLGQFLKMAQIVAKEDTQS